MAVAILVIAVVCALDQIREMFDEMRVAELRRLGK